MAKVQIGLKLAPDLVAELDAKARADGVTRTEGVEQALRQWLDGGALDGLPEAPKPPKPAPPVRKAAPVVRITPETTKAPPVSRARLHVDVPHGRERPAFGSMLKGPKPPRR